MIGPAPAPVEPPARPSPATDGVEPDYGVRPFTKAITPYLDHHEKMAIRTAAFRACRLYPGPVGDVLSRELLAWEEFGVRLGYDKLIMRLVRFITASQITDGRPEPTSAAPAPFRPGLDTRR